ncbi:MAG TPA: hypothetical protein DDW87_13360 [Firmicutes bacterium]|mgnify:FL=1|nr:hypothetical protein [Bacillota bacterium]
MRYSDYLEQMAALIKRDPSITVRQIAHELKFADSKSVYYWLDKGNVGGINEFKRLVLSQDASYPSSPAYDVAGVRHYLVPLPLFGWNPKQKNPTEEWYYLHRHPKPQGFFAVRVGTNQYSPWFMQNDVLVISASAAYPGESWVLLKTQDQFVIGKVIDKKVVDPMTLTAYRPNLSSVGLIVSQKRYFSS